MTHTPQEKLAALAEKMAFTGNLGIPVKADCVVRWADELNTLLSEHGGGGEAVAWQSPFGACVCDGDNACPGCNPNVAIDLAREIATADERRKHPPCMECGATSPEDAQGKCVCGGDKDDCHGCELWPEGTTPLTPSAPVVDDASPRFFIDHGVVHDRATGQHVGASFEDDSAERLLALLTRLEQETWSWRMTAKALNAALSGVSASVGVEEGWALTKLRAHESRCGACGRAVWDGQDRATCIGFLAPCGKRIARLEDCGTVDCVTALTPPAAAPRVEHGIADHGIDRAAKEVLVPCDCGCGRSCCACCGTDLGFITERPPTPAAPSAPPSVARDAGELPELPTPAHPTHSLGPLYSAAQMRWYGEQARRLAASGQGVNWLPIETAPRDGTLIDIWAQSLIDLADGGQQVAVEFRVPDASWFDGQWCNSDGNPHDDLEGFTNMRFTHWMPLPAAPTQEKGNG